MGALEEVKDLAEAVTRRRSLRLWDVEMGGPARPGGRPGLRRRATGASTSTPWPRSPRRSPEGST